MFRAVKVALVRLLATREHRLCEADAPPEAGGAQRHQHAHSRAAAAAAAAAAARRAWRRQRCRRLALRRGWQAARGAAQLTQRRGGLHSQRSAAARRALHGWVPAADDARHGRRHLTERVAARKHGREGRAARVAVCARRGGGHALVVAGGVRTAEWAVALARPAVALALLGRAPRLAEPTLTGLTRLLRRPPAALVLHCAARTYRCSRRANTAPPL